MGCPVISSVWQNKVCAETADLPDSGAYCILPIYASDQYEIFGKSVLCIASLTQAASIDSRPHAKR